MKSRVLGAVLAVVSLLFPAVGVPGAQESQVSARWKPGVFHLGDPAELDIELPVKSPDFYLEGGLSSGSEWGVGRISDIENIPPPAFPGTLKLRVKVQLFRTGDVRLPKSKIILRLADSRVFFIVNPPPIHVTPLLPPGPQPEPPPATPLPLPASIPWLLIGCLAAAVPAIVITAVLLLRRAKQKKKIPGKAELALKEIDSDKWIRSEVERLFRTDLPLPTRYEILSRRLREYLELTVSRPFLEWTTTQIRHSCPEIEQLSGKPSERLVDVLRFCDSVLFARFTPGRDEEERTRMETFRLLDEVAPLQEEKAS